MQGNHARGIVKKRIGAIGSPLLRKYYDELAALGDGSIALVCIEDHRKIFAAVYPGHAQKKRRSQIGDFRR